MSKVETATAWMIGIANDDSHGYSQPNRGGNPDFDCSSLDIAANEYAGIPVKKYGASYTGNMKNAYIKAGYQDVTKSISLSSGKGLVRGDVLLHEGHHVARYIGDGQLVHASIDENGTVVGKTPGDQTGKEICVRSYYNHPWNVVLRYPEENTTTTASVTYTQEDFIRGVQSCLGAKVDGIAGPETLSKTITVSAKVNRNHPVVKHLQSWFNILGCNAGEVDGWAGPKFTAAAILFANTHGCEPDGEITTGQLMWKKLLGMVK